MKNTHTPGPWVFVEADSLDTDRIETVSGEIVICDGVTQPDTPIGKANARLIAAAPDLIAALEGLVSRVDTPRKLTHAEDVAEMNILWSAARLAITKAKGG